MTALNTNEQETVTPTKHQEEDVEKNTYRGFFQGKILQETRKF